MGIQDGASPEWEHPGGPPHCIGQLPPLPPGGGKGTERQKRPLTHEYMPRPGFGKGSSWPIEPLLEDVLPR